MSRTKSFLYEEKLCTVRLNFLKDAFIAQFISLQKSHCKNICMKSLILNVYGCKLIQCLLMKRCDIKIVFILRLMRDFNMHRKLLIHSDNVS